MKEGITISFYNMVHGVNPLSETLCEVLGVDFTKIERFRDSGIDKLNKIIWIYTRTGGNNREDYKNEVLTSNINYIKDYDDSFDETYAMYEFKIPEEFSYIIDFDIDNKPDWKRTLENLKI